MTRTIRDVYEYQKSKYSIFSSSRFYVNLDEPITDQEYERRCRVIDAVKSIFDTGFSDKDGGQDDSTE